MEHEESAAKITDWVRGSLGEGAQEVTAHVLGCSDCQASADAARALEAARGVLAARAVAHPTSDELAAYVVAAPQEPMATLAVVGWHLRGCTECRRDADLLRAADHAGPWRRLMTSLRAAPWTGVPALAAGLLLLAYPAYRGLRPVQQADQSTLEGGPVRALVLRETERALGGIPTLQISPGQTVQVLLLDTAPRGEAVTVRLFAPQTSSALWTYAAPAQSFWDAENQVIGIMLPTTLLQPGEYRIELSDGEAPSWFRAGFRVASPE